MESLEKLRIRLNSQFELNPKLWNEIQKNSKEIKLKKNEILVPYSSKDKAAYIIIDGSLKQLIIDTNGLETATWFFFENFSNVAVCFDSYFLDEYTKYELTALEDTVVLKVEKKKIEGWADQFPAFNKFYREDCIKSFILSVEVRNYMVSRTPREFLIYLRNFYPQILNKVPLKYLAEFMGITPEWLSKLNNQVIRI